MGTRLGTTGRQPRIRAALLPGTLLAYGTGAALHRIHAGHGDPGLSPTMHWLRDSSLAWPLAVSVVVLAGLASTRLVRWAGLEGRGGAEDLAWALPAAVLYAGVVVPAGAVHAMLFPGAVAGHEHAASFAPAASFAQTALVNAATALLTGLLLLLAGRALARAAARRRTARERRALRALRRVALGGATALALVLGLTPAPDGPATATAASATTVATCGAATAERAYDVAAISVHIPYNRWGEGNDSGMVYALQSDKSAIRDWYKPLSEPGSKRRLRPRPLVIRANEGECVRVNFTNELDPTPGDGLPVNPRASISVRGVPFDVQSSGGSNVGYNDDTTVGIGESVTHYWLAPKEGIYFFSDTATPAGSEADGGSLAHGLYGAFVVEPAGSTWTDIRTGNALYTGTTDQSGELYLQAVIDPPTGRTFRESVQLAQDEFPHTSTFGFNYGSEPGYNRAGAAQCPDCVGEETSLSSWAYGDPSMVKLASGLGPWRPRSPEGAEDCGLGTPGFDADSCFTSNVTHAYVGDPIKFRYGLAGVKETHVFHMHAHQWLAEDKDVGGSGPTPGQPGPGAAMPASTTIDSQTFGPMEMFTADLLFGAGSKPGTVGDSIFHCHLYPHFADGFWALFRAHDVLEDGTGKTPDGVFVEGIKPLGDVTGPALPTPTNPGYPRFIPGKFGWRAPQPPLGVSDNGVPATRFVAGEPLVQTSPEVALETAVRTTMSEGRSTPGAPFRDPCPPGAREVTYKVSAIQTNVVYNERGDHDTQGRLLILDSDVDDVLAGRKNPDPMFARVNAGDCVNWQLTNRMPNWFGNDAFLKMAQTNMFGQHIHLVKFDVMASDGASNGWNYQEAAFSRAQADFNAGLAANPGSCTSTKCRLDLPADYDPTTTSLGIRPGQTIHERWYADYEVRTVFTHDHHFPAVDQNRGQFGALVVEPAGMDFRDPRTGAWLQPVNTSGRGVPVCQTACEGRAAGASMDVIGPGADDDFRDFGLAIADFVSLTKPGGDPRTREGTINPPLVPEEFPDDDPGVMGMNYRNAPLELRRTKNGSAVDPAYVFSSHVFGDPRTPVLQTYAGDNVRIRLIQGSQEEQHQVLLHGQKWRKEPNDPQSPMVDASPIGVSEAFNFEVPRLNCPVGTDCRGDYLYSGAGLDDMATGAWGILRVNGGTVPGLKPLPDNVPTRTGTVPAKSATALAPPAATSPGKPCPTGAPVRRFAVVAMQAKITYNDRGDHDPYGLVYALAKDEATIRAGRNPEPLVLRANEGDCIEVTLTNKLTTTLLKHRGPADGDATTPAEPTTARTPGLRVSMHPGLLKYDVRGSDGAAVGFNRDSTVGAGKSFTYRWYADAVTPGEIGALNLTDYGDVRGHRHHGLFGGLIVEPPGATWYDPVTGRPLDSGAQADIRVPGRPDYRESVVFFQDGANLRTATGAIIGDPADHPPLPGEPAEPLDSEDQGEKAFSYRNAPFRHRLGYEPVGNDQPAGRAMADVYDSHVHGDPMTPMMRAYSGDDLVVRVLQGSDKPRQHAFGLSGHGFKPQPDDPDGRSVGTLSGITVGSAINARMGTTGTAGDYLYGCMVGFFHRSGGLWGMLRVYPQPAGATELQPTAVPPVDDPRAGGHPLLPLDLDTIRATAFSDLDGDGVRDAGEPLVADTVVAAKTGGTVVSTGRSGSDGLAWVPVRPGGYDLAVTAPSGYVVSQAPATATTGGNNAVRSVSVALRKL